MWSALFGTYEDEDEEVDELELCHGLDVEIFRWNLKVRCSKSFDAVQICKNKLAL